jgi:integrase
MAPLVVDGLRAHRDRVKFEQKTARDKGDEWHDHDFVFPRHTDGEPLHGVAVTAQFHRQAARAGMPRCRVHDPRGMAGTLLLAGGADLKTVQETLGHHSIKLTGDVYVQAVSQARRDVAERMQQALGGM